MDEYSSQYSSMWMKSKRIPVGAGFIWPPRCYSCSFCKREFRCAQALGGHMNVHRRDRARLKQNEPLSQSHSKSLSNPKKQSPARNSEIASLTLSSKFSHLAYSPEIKELAAGQKIISSSQTEAAVRVSSMAGSKRQKSCMVSSLPMLHKPCSTHHEKYSFTTCDYKVGIRTSSSSMEDIDLELRLAIGDPPAKQLLTIGLF